MNANLRLVYERLENWGRVVRDNQAQAQVCAKWAKWYIAKGRGFAGEEDEPPRPIVRPDYLDGWLVESAWKGMQDAEYKWILKYHFVLRMPQSLLIARMKSHGSNDRRLKNFLDGGGLNTVVRSMNRTLLVCNV